MFLFRGTTEGFAGGTYRRFGFASASNDPVVAKLFATTASKYDSAIVHVIPMDKFAGPVQDNRSSNPLAALEGEFIIEASPEEIASASITLSAAVAKDILEQMDVAFPANTWNLADLNAALHLTRRLHDEEVRDFVRRAENQL